MYSSISKHFSSSLTFNYVFFNITIGDFEVHQTWCNPVDICIVKNRNSFEEIQAFLNERDQCLVHYHKLTFTVYPRIYMLLWFFIYINIKLWLKVTSPKRRIKPLSDLVLWSDVTVIIIYLDVLEENFSRFALMFLRSFNKIEHKTYNPCQLNCIRYVVTI